MQAAVFICVCVYACMIVCVCAVAGLFLGGMEGALDAKELKRRGITHVVNAANYDAYPRCYHKGEFQYMILSCGDVATEDISQHFHKTNWYIAEALKQGGAVYVHCYAGVSRAPTLVMAYLMGHAGLSLRQALSECVRARPQVRPNPGFIRQLEVYGEALASGGGGQQGQQEARARAQPASYGGMADHYFNCAPSVTAPTMNDPLRNNVGQPSYPPSYPPSYQASTYTAIIPTHQTSTYTVCPTGTRTPTVIPSVSSSYYGERPSIPMSSLVARNSLGHSPGHDARSQGVSVFGQESKEESALGHELSAFGSPPGTRA